MGTDARHAEPRLLGARPQHGASTKARTAGIPVSGGRPLATVKDPRRSSRPRPRPVPVAGAAAPVRLHPRPRPIEPAAARPDRGARPRPSVPSRALVAFGLLVALVVLTFKVAPSAGAGGGGSFSDEGVEGLVEARGAELFANGEPFRAVGFNDYRLAAAPGGEVCDEAYGEIDDDELADRLDRAADSGATVIRTWFFQSSWDPDGDGEGDWSAFDRVVTAAAERGLRVVPVIANHWGDCEAGGMSKTYDFYAGGFREPYGADALSYLDYARKLAERYAGSPAIAFWQLINEPEAGAAEGCDEAAAAEALAGFADEASAVIRAADPEHLVSLGTIGGGQCGTAGQNYMAAHEAIDVCEIHVYDDEGAETSPTTALPGDATNGVAARISACEASGKPIVAGEIGFAADLDASGSSTGAVTDETLQNRADFLEARVAAMTELGLDGFMVWQLDSRTPGAEGADTYAVGPCDPVETVIAAGSGAPRVEAGCG